LASGIEPIQNDYEESVALHGTSIGSPSTLDRKDVNGGSLYLQVEEDVTYYSYYRAGPIFSCGIIISIYLWDYYNKYFLSI